MSRLQIKYMKAGRMPKALKLKSLDLKVKCNEYGETGRYEFSTMEELNELTEMLQRKFARTVDISDELITDKSTTEDMSEPVVEPIAEPQSNPQPQGYDFGEDFAGMDESVIKRSYNEVPVNEFTGVDIQEPEVSSAIDAMLQRERGDALEAESSSGDTIGETPNSPISNPAMNELGDKEKTLAAEQFADGILNAYEALHPAAANIAKFKEPKLTKLINDGEIDEDHTFTVDASGNEMNIMEYSEVYNSSVDRIMTYDPEFNEQVRPPLVRLLKKNDIGLTDGQAVAVAFIQDGGMKLAQLIQLSQGQKMIINSLKDLNRNRKQEVSEAKSPDSISRPIKDEK
jgi:hypothetical protein